jgi:tRNA-splicing ligase RtcB
VQKKLEKKESIFFPPARTRCRGLQNIDAVMAEQQDQAKTIARFDPRIVKMSGDGSRGLGGGNP